MAQDAKSARESPSQSATSEPVGRTLDDLLIARGRRGLPADLAAVARLAFAAQAQRRSEGVADRDAVDRSTMLWAVLAIDPEIALAVAEGDLSAEKLRAALRITVTPAPAEADAGAEAEGDTAALVLDASLEHAIEEQLASSDDAARFGRIDLATAILVSGLEPGGLLPSRLSKSDANVRDALDGLARLRSGSGVSGFSRTVRQARDSLGPEREITATQLVRALGKLPLSGPLAQADLSVDQGRPAATDIWLARVRSSYDAAEVLGSERGIVDAELTVRALAELDPPLGRSLEAVPETEKWLQGIRPRPAVERKTDPSADVPAEVDLLGRDTLAATMARHLEVISSRGEASLLIHLDGPWGAGKSSLLGFLKKHLEGDYVVVEVNAWREQRVGAQWWTLYRALRAAQLDAATNWWGRLRSRLGHMGDVLVVRRDKLWPVLLTLGVVVLGLWIITTFGLGVSSDQLGVPQALSVVAVTFGGLTAAYRFLAPASPRSARALVETSSNPMAEVSALFARSLDRAAPHPVIFLIDDLDRCEPDYVIRFLEVVQTLVRDAPPSHGTRPRQDGAAAHGAGDARGDDDKDKVRRGPYAVVAADGHWLRSCYQKAYGELVQDELPGKPLGYRFLEKIFQMHIRLPNVEDETKQRYYESLLFPGGRDRATTTSADQKLSTEIKSDIRTVRSTEDLSNLNQSIGQVADSGVRQVLRAEALKQVTTTVAVRRQLHELSPFVDLLEANPRTIRLFVNAVSIQAYLRFLEGNSFELPSLALWAVVEARWPELADHLRDHPEDVVVRARREGEEPTMPADLDALLRSEGVGAVLRSQRWDDFDAARVRSCTGG